MWKTKPKYYKEKILNKILINTLKLSRKSKFTNKTLTQFLYGTRNGINIFQMSELQYSLLRLYPLIQSLFNNFQSNAIFRKREEKKIYSKSFPSFFKNKKTNNYNWDWRWNKSTNCIISKPKIQILFVTTTTKYEQIIQSAAQLCQMPFHIGNWKTGTMTARAFYIKDPTTWCFLTTDKTECLPRYFKKKYNSKQTRRNFFLYQKLAWKNYTQPSLIIIPDISTNRSVIKESKNLGIPIIGIINSDDAITIDYPFFSNSNAISVVYFFCHFLANLISKQLNNRQDPNFDINLKHSFSLVQNNKKARKKRTPIIKWNLKKKEKKMMKIRTSIKKIAQKKIIKKIEISKYEKRKKRKPNK